MDISTRVVPERRMAVIAREVTEPELDGFVRWAFAEIFDHLVAAGYRTHGTTREEPTMVIFHGPVTPDQASLVEACVPFAGDVPAHSAIAVRSEPEHHEAFVTVTRAQLEYPAILNAYDAVAAWVAENGSISETMPSREVYVAEVPEAGDDDEVCDIAFPYRPHEV